MYVCYVGDGQDVVKLAGLVGSRQERNGKARRRGRVIYCSDLALGLGLEIAGIKCQTEREKSKGRYLVGQGRQEKERKKGCL